MLNCLHCFCRACLAASSGTGGPSEELTESVETPKISAVECPTCNQPTQLPIDGVLNSLPVATYLCRMVDLYARMPRSGADGAAKAATPVPQDNDQGSVPLDVAGRDELHHQECEECGKTGPGPVVVGFCEQCKHFICKECVDVHRRMKVLSDHVLLDANVQKDDEVFKKITSFNSPNTTRQSKFPICPIHGAVDGGGSDHDDGPAAARLDLFCLKCKTAVCKDCKCVALGRHLSGQKHEVVPILESAEKQRKELEMHICTLKEKQSSMLKEVEALTSKKEKVQEAGREILSTIGSSIAALIKKLEKEKGNLFNHVNSLVETRLGEISEMVKAVEENESQIEFLLQSSAPLLQFSDDLELLKLGTILLHRVNELEARDRSRSPVRSADGAGFVLPLSPARKLLDICQDHVREHHLVDLSKVTVEFSPETTPAKVGEETRFTVVTRYGSGSTCVEHSDVNVDIEEARSCQKLSPTLVPDVELGTYMISFTPKHRGQLKITVKLYTQEIPSSPIFVSVTPSLYDLSQHKVVIPKMEWPWGVACCPSTREVYVTLHSQCLVVVVSNEGKYLRRMGLKGQKTGCLWYPTGIAVGSGGSGHKETFVYVADGKDVGRIQKFSQSGNVVAVYSSSLSDVAGIWLSKKNRRLYVCDQKNCKVVMLNEQLQLISTFGDFLKPAGEFHEVTGGFISPHSLAEDSDGNVYVSDSKSGCIGVFSQRGVHLKTLQKPGNEDEGESFAPTGICVAGDYVYSSDKAANQVVVFHTNGKYVTSYGRFGHGPGQFYNPLSIAVDVDGYMYLCDYTNKRVLMY